MFTNINYRNIARDAKAYIKRIIKKCMTSKIMQAEYYIIKIDSHIVENDLEETKLLIFFNFIFSMILSLYFKSNL